MDEQNEPLMRFFEYAHLPKHLQAVSAIFQQAARTLMVDCPQNFERKFALRKLLEAKDCAVRSLLLKGEE